MARDIAGKAWGKAAVAGLVGGLLMGMYMMTVLALSGATMWRPLNAIATVIPAFRPVAAGFEVGPTLSGLMIHMVNSAVLGLIFAAFIYYVTPRAVRSYGVSGLLGAVYGTLVWLVLGVVVAPMVAPAMAAVPQGHFFIAHLIYGIATALIVTAWVKPREVSITFAPATAAEREHLRH